MAFEMLINLANGSVSKKGSGAYKQAPNSYKGVKSKQRNKVSLYILSGVEV
ncbi:Uncharacterized protein BCF24048_01884 [Bacillus cereus]|nr:Uncharacterized protein BCF24048_01884 [Bacillus cereus]